MEEGRFIEFIRGSVERVAECAETLGPEVHIQSDYGDEWSWRTPWELFDEAEAQQALSIAEEAVLLATQIVQGG